MSLIATEVKNAQISSTAVLLSSTTFGFASTNITSAQRATIFSSSAALLVGLTTVAPTTNTLGIPIAAGGSLVVNGGANIQRIQVIAQTTSANVSILLEK